MIEWPDLVGQHAKDRRRARVGAKILIRDLRIEESVLCYENESKSNTRTERMAAQPLRLIYLAIIVAFLVVQFHFFVPRSNTVHETHVSLTDHTSTTNHSSTVHVAAVAVHNDTTQSSQGREEQKPRLIFHVGPMKTGTTSIQNGILGKRQWVKILRSDGIQVVKGLPYHQYPRLVELCLSRQDIKDCEMDLWKAFVSPFDEALRQANTTPPFDTVLYSCEALSTIPDTNTTRFLFQSLSATWNVEVVLFHRQPYGWLPSAYYQSRKTNHFRSRSGRYNNFPREYIPLAGKNSSTDQSTLPSFLDDRYFHQRDSLSTDALFSSLFSRESLRHYDFHAPHGLTIEFLCNALGRHTSACQRALDMQPDGLKVLNQGGTYLYDEDLLVLTAHSRGFLRSAGDKKYKNRRQCTLALKAQLEQWNVTLKEHFPRACLDARQEAWLWNRTVETNRWVAPNPMPIFSLRLSFKEALPKQCSLDPEAVLADPQWITFFESSCIFLENPAASNCSFDHTFSEKGWIL